MTRDELAALLDKRLAYALEEVYGITSWPVCRDAADEILAAGWHKSWHKTDTGTTTDGYAVVKLPAEASENVWTNDITGHVYATVTGRMVVLDDGELLDPDEVRHYAAALLAAARKAEETR